MELGPGPGKGRHRLRANSMSGADGNRTSKEGSGASTVSATSVGGSSKGEVAKSHQRKMTEFMSGGAGELPSGPRGPTTLTRSSSTTAVSAASTGATGASASGSTAATSGAGTAAQGSSGTSLTLAEVDKIKAQMMQRQKEANEIATAQQILQQVTRNALGGTAGASSAGVPTEEPQGQGQSQEGESWQVWTSRKNRRVGGDLGEQDRQAREKNPFQLPGQPHALSRGYYTSTYKRNQARADQYRLSKSSAAAALTRDQWDWFRSGSCIGCGEKHQVKDCKVTSNEEGRALIRAALSCPPDMRPGSRTGERQGKRVPPPPSGPSAARRAAAATATSGANPGGPAPAPTPSTASKRARDTTAPSSGLTPEAKKAKQFADAVKSSLTLYVREKDGSALTKERFMALKASFAYFVEDMMSKNKDPPICSGRWQESRAVVKIPMASEDDLLWMRCFLDKAYLVQNESEFNKSKGKIYVTYLKDRLEPEFTGMRMEKLSNFVRYFKRQAGIDSLFEIKMAAKTPKGKAIHLIMDDKAEESFVQLGCRIPFAGAGWISFEERTAYVARIKALERERLKPKPSALRAGLDAQEMGKMAIGGSDDEVVVVGEKRKPSPGECQELVQELRKQVDEGRISQESAQTEALEKLGMNMEEVLPPRRTDSGSSWSEEVEHMNSLSQTEATATAGDDGGEDEDQARFEMEQDAQARGGHRAEGSGQSAEGAAGSPI